MFSPPPGPVDNLSYDLAGRLPSWPEQINAADRQEFCEARLKLAEAEVEPIPRAVGQGELPRRLRLIPLFSTFRGAMAIPHSSATVLELAMQCDRRLMMARVEQDRDDSFPPVRTVLESRLCEARDAIDTGDIGKLFRSVRCLDDRTGAWLRRSFELLEISPYREPPFDAEAMGAAARAALAHDADPVPGFVRSELRALEQAAPLLAARDESFSAEDHWNALSDLATYYVDLGMHLTGRPILRAPSPDATAIVRGFEHAIASLRRGPPPRPLLDLALRSLVIVHQVLGSGRSWSNNGGLSGPLVSFLRDVAALYGLRAAASDGRLRSILSR